MQRFLRCRPRAVAAALRPRRVDVGHFAGERTLVPAETRGGRMMPMVTWLYELSGQERMYVSRRLAQGSRAPVHPVVSRESSIIVCRRGRR